MSLPPPHVTNVCTRDLQAIAARPRSDPKRAQRCNPNRHACPAASCRGLPTGALVSQQLFRSPKDMENLICCGPHKFPKFPKIDSFLVFKTRLGFQCVHIDRWIRALASTNFGQEYRPSTWEITFILKVIFILVPNKLGETKGQCRTEHIGKPRKGTLVGPSFTHPQKINGLCFARCEHHMGCHNMVSTQIACNVSRYTSIVQPYSFFPTTGLWIMGKGSEFARKSRSRMPYSADSGEKKVPTSWKMKQRSYTMAGLRRLRAPWVPRLSQSSAPNVEWDMGFKMLASQYQGIEPKRCSWSTFITTSCWIRYHACPLALILAILQHESTKSIAIVLLVWIYTKNPITSQAWTPSKMNIR